MRALVAVLISLSLAAPPALAQGADRERELIRRLQLQLRKVDEERAQLASQKADAEQKAAALEKKLSAEQEAAADASRRADGLEGSVAALRKENEALRARQEGELERLKAQLAQESARGRELASKLEQTEAQRARLDAAAGICGQDLDLCRKKNGELSALSRELAEKYRDKGLLDVLLKGEPFTGLRQVEVENTVEDALERIEALRAEPGGRP